MGRSLKGLSTHPIIITMEDQEPQASVKPSIKLSVSTKGVYTWEIRIVGLDVNELKAVNDKMIMIYGFPKGAKDENA